MHTGTTLLVTTALAVAPQFPVPSGSGSGVPPDRVAAGSGVVVNEFVPGGYVELRNTTPSTVDIGGHVLWLCGPDGVSTEVRVSLGMTLSPGDFYLVASSSFTGAAADQTYRGTLPGRSTQDSVSPSSSRVGSCRTSPACVTQHPATIRSSKSITGSPSDRRCSNRFTTFVL